MDREQEVIHKQMEETRSDLTNKLAALENQVGGTVQAATNVVQSTTEAVTVTVESVQETVENVTGKLQETVEGVTETVQQAVEGVKESVAETVQSVAETFNLKLQSERHPWIVFCGAVTVGCVGTMLLSGSGRRPTPTSQSGSLSPEDNGGKTKSAWSPTQPEPSADADRAGVSDWLWDKLKGLRNLAVGAMVGAARDLVTQALPEKLKERVSEEVDKLTKSLGGEPIQGAILTEDRSHESESSQDEESAAQPSSQAGDKGKSEKTDGRGGRPALVKNGR